MRHALLFAAVFAACYGGASLLTAQYASLPAWDLPFEQHVPFVPALSIVYLTITPALLVVLSRTHRNFAIALCIQTLLATLCFLLFPQTVAWTRPAVAGWARIPFGIADAMNLSYNQFPSLHVAFAVSAAWAMRKPLWWIWSGAVAISTWLMWEHHLVDLLGGAALALVVMPLLYPRVHVELQCLWQCAHFSRRHVRYFVIFLAIWLPSLLHWRRYKAVRLGFCAAQWIDDLLDGDRPSQREPLEIVDDLLARRFGTDDLSQLVAAFLNHLDEPAQHEFMDLVRCMRVDRLRVLHHQRWTQPRLDAHYEATFRHSVNLMLITTGCTARASDVPSLIPALAWCSVVRDLDDDLHKGLINIPHDTDVAQWTRDSHTRACIALQSATEEIAHLTDRRAHRILGMFQRSIAKYAARPLDAYPLLLHSWLPMWIASLLLFVSVSAFAATAAPVLTERSPAAPDVQVLLQARSTFLDLNGTAWIYHGLTGQRDPKAAAVTAVRADGSTRPYFAGDILPRGAMKAGTVGSVFAITPLTTPGNFAATAGWFGPDGAPKTAVVFFHEARDGTITNCGVVRVAGARAIAAGPQDHAVVASNLSLATLVNADGRIVRMWPDAAYDGMADARLYQIDEESIAVHDVVRQRVHAVRVSSHEGAIEIADLWTVSVSDTSDSGAEEVLPAIGFAATKDGVVTVVRPIVVDERPRTLVTRYTTRGRERSWSSDHFWRAALVSPTEARGIVQKATPWEERVSLAE